MTEAGAAEEEAERRTVGPHGGGGVGGEGRHAFDSEGGEEAIRWPESWSPDVGAWRAQDLSCERHMCT